MKDGYTILETCKKLEELGADVVGLNCFRGPATMFPYIKEKLENSLKVMLQLFQFLTELMKNTQHFLIFLTTMIVVVHLLMAGHFQLLWIHYNVTDEIGNFAKEAFTI